MNTDLIIAITSIVVAISAAFGTYFSEGRPEETI